MRQVVYDTRDVYGYRRGHEPLSFLGIDTPRQQIEIPKHPDLKDCIASLAVVFSSQGRDIAVQYGRQCASSNFNWSLVYNHRD